MRRNRKLLTKTEDNDSLSVLTNLFDVSMVFAVALMLISLVNSKSKTRETLLKAVKKFKAILSDFYW